MTKYTQFVHLDGPVWVFFWSAGQHHWSVANHSFKMHHFDHVIVVTVKRNPHWLWIGNRKQTAVPRVDKFLSTSSLCGLCHSITAGLPPLLPSASLRPLEGFFNESKQMSFACTFSWNFMILHKWELLEVQCSYSIPLLLCYIYG